MIISESEIDGAIPATPSRWHTQLCLALASMAFGRSRLERAAVDDVTIGLMKGLESMGAAFSVSGGDVAVEGGLFHPRGEIDAGIHSSNLALLCAVASNLPRPSRISFESRRGEAYPFLNALMALGVSVSSKNRGRDPPWVIKGPGRSGRTHVAGDLPPAYVCSLPLASVMRMRDVEITVSPPDRSTSSMGVAQDAMARFGLGMSFSEGRVRVSGSEPLRPATVKVRDDHELACYPLVAGALCGRATVRGDLAHEAGVGALRSFQVDIESSGDSVTARASAIEGLDVDMSHLPRAFPALAVLSARARGGARLHSALLPGRDLITPTVKMLRRMGCPARATGDGAHIPRCDLQGAELGEIDDPLVCMAAIIAAVSSEGDTSISNPGICEEECPGFLRHMGLLGMRTGERWP